MSVTQSVTQEGSPRAPPDLPRGPQDAPRGPPGAPRWHPKATTAPQKRPRGSREVTDKVTDQRCKCLSPSLSPRKAPPGRRQTSQEGPRTPQEGPTAPQEGTQYRPRRHKSGPEAAERRPKSRNEHGLKGARADVASNAVVPCEVFLSTASAL